MLLPSTCISTASSADGATHVAVLPLHSCLAACISVSASLVNKHGCGQLERALSALNSGDAVPSVLSAQGDAVQKQQQQLSRNLEPVRTSLEELSDSDMAFALSDSLQKCSQEPILHVF